MVGKFLTGSLLRHVTVMTLTSSVGLLTMFVVDFVNLLYIAQLGVPALTAGMGYAATILFFFNAINIGLMIATSALASRKIGQGDAEYARRLLTNVSVIGLAFGIPIAFCFWFFSPDLLDLAGASGTTKSAAILYITIVAPILPLSVISMICSGFLRAHGAARLAMNVTLSLGITNAILDPIFIFGLDMGFVGAAWSTICASLVSALFAIVPVIRQFGGFQPWSLPQFQEDLPAITGIMFPAVLTNLATPAGGFIAYRFMGDYSDDAIAGYAVIGRMVPVLFCLIFSLSGAVGPIIGQNFGAHQFDRVRQTLRQAMLFAFFYTLAIWPLVLILSDPIANLFKLGPEGRELFWLFALVFTPLFFFNGMLFISNAACNNLGRPSWSMWTNWGRNILGTLPFIWLGSHYFGAPGVLLGPAFGGIVFGIGAYWLSRNLVGKLQQTPIVPAPQSALAQQN